jgi:hypothetical protein
MTDDLKERKYLSERTGKKTSDSKQIEYQFCCNSNSSVRTGEISLTVSIAVSFILP